MAEGVPKARSTNEGEPETCAGAGATFPTPYRLGVKLALYGYDACPYCQRVRRAIDDLGLEVEERDVLAHPERRDELRQALGRGTVPVLRIDDGSTVRWLPESGAIVAWLYASQGREPPRGPSLRRLATFLMWGLVAVALFFPEHEGPLFVAALSIGAGRSLANARATRSWLHGAIAATFLFGAVAVLLQHLGIVRIPWWYGVYALVLALALASVAARLGARRQRS